jgi:hypothetical protein
MCDEESQRYYAVQVAPLKTNQVLSDLEFEVYPVIQFIRHDGPGEWWEREEVGAIIDRSKGMPGRYNRISGSHLQRMVPHQDGWYSFVDWSRPSQEDRKYLERYASKLRSDGKKERAAKREAKKTV